MRTKGYSMKEISALLSVAKSTASVWVRDVALSRSAQERIAERCTKGQLAAQEAHYEQTRRREQDARDFAQGVMKKFHPDQVVERVMCSLLYLCEGGKIYNNRGNFAFVNSDPALVASYLNLLRRSFVLDESKFRACIHLHGYHDAKAQLAFWAKVTRIPTRQFMRPHLKKESGQSIRAEYQGCIQVVYNDKMMLRQILALSREFLAKYGPIV